MIKWTWFGWWRSWISIALLCVPAFASRTFNGTSDVITISGSSTAIDVTGQALSISAWVYFATVPSAEMEPLAKADSGATQYEIYINAAGQPSKTLGVYFRQSTSLNHDVYMNCASAATNGTWTHIVAAYSSVATTWFMYCNGVQATNGSTGSAATIMSNGDSLLIGKKAASSAIYCACSVADVGVWTAQISPLEAKSLASGKSPATVHRNALVGYFPLWGASGTNPEPDYSGNANNGTLTGTSLGPPFPCLPVVNQ